MSGPAANRGARPGQHFLCFCPLHLPHVSLLCLCPLGRGLSRPRLFIFSPRAANRGAHPPTTPNATHPPRGSPRGVFHFTNPRCPGLPPKVSTHPPIPLTRGGGGYSACMNRIARRSPGPITLAWAIVVVGYATGVSSAQPASLAELQQWIDGQRRVVERLGHTDPVKLKWLVRLPASVTREDVARTEQELERFPDHPLRGRLAEMRERLSKGWVTERLLMAGGGRWRVAMTQTTGSQDIVDFGLDGDDTWSWSGPTVNVASSRTAPSGYEYATVVGEYRGDIVLLLSGGLFDTGLAKRRWAAAWNADGSWTATCDFEFGSDRRSAVAQGVWRNGKGEVAHVGVHHADGTLVYTIASEGWHESGCGVALAKVVDCRTPAASFRHLTLLECNPISQAEVRAASRVPDPARPDPLRESAQIQVVADHRGPRPAASVLAPEGRVKIPLTTPERDVATRRVRLAGWILGGLSLLGVVVTWLRWGRRSAA